jgi:hypothetical protein
MSQQVKEEGNSLQCPYCGDDYVHLESVRVNAGGQVVQVERDETKLTKDLPKGRGALVEIVYWCETGHHKWRRRLQFHKGQTLTSDELLLFVHPNLDPGHFPANDLWRD